MIRPEYARSVTQAPVTVSANVDWGEFDARNQNKGEPYYTKAAAENFNVIEGDYVVMRVDARDEANDVLQNHPNIFGLAALNGMIDNAYPSPDAAASQYVGAGVAHSAISMDHRKNREDLDGMSLMVGGVRDVRITGTMPVLAGDTLEWAFPDKTQSGQYKRGTKAMGQKVICRKEQIPPIIRPLHPGGNAAHLRTIAAAIPGVMGQALPPNLLYGDGGRTDPHMRQAHALALFVAAVIKFHIASPVNALDALGYLAGTKKASDELLEVVENLFGRFSDDPGVRAAARAAARAADKTAYQALEHLNYVFEEARIARDGRRVGTALANANGSNSKGGPYIPVLLGK